MPFLYKATAFSKVGASVVNLILSKENVDEKLNLDSYKSIKYEGIKELKDEIVYNKYKYKLDSILLDDYKTMSDNSEITSGNRYGMVGLTRTPEGGPSIVT